jgi:hypothetical protein
VESRSKSRQAEIQRVRALNTPPSFNGAWQEFGVMGLSRTIDNSEKNKNILLALTRPTSLDFYQDYVVRDPKEEHWPFSGYG